MSKQPYPHARVTWVLILILTCAALSMAQPPESFFPSQVGDLWQYAGDVGTNTNWRISHDSLGADGSKILFHVYPPPYGELPRYKIDTLTYVYENPYPKGWDRIYKLNADTGEVWTWHFYGDWGWLYAITTYQVFGIPTTVKIFRLGPFSPDSGGNAYYFKERHLASGFGLVLDWEEPDYMYWLSGCVISGDTFGTVVSVPQSNLDLPVAVTLSQNYPNPFNPATTIEYEVARRCLVSLAVFDVVGRQVGVLARGVHQRGKYRVQFDGGSLSSGVYLCRIVTPFGKQTKRMLLLR